MTTKRLAAFLLALCMLISLTPAVCANPDTGSPGVTADAGQEALRYVDESGQEQLITDYTVLTGEETILPEGWYAVLHDISYSGTLYLKDDIRIILADGCTMNVGAEDGGLDLGVLHNTETGSLTIYGQSEGTGTLNAWAKYPILMTHSSDHDNPYTQNGGNVNAWGGTHGLDAKIVNVNRGALHAEGEDYGIVAPSLNVNGGRVEAHALLWHGINSTTVNILGGRVTALTDSENYFAYGVNAASITLGCAEPEDFIAVSRYSQNTALQIAEGQILTDGEKGYYGTIMDPYLLSGKTLRSARGLVILDDGIWNGSVSVSQENPVAPGTELTLTLTPQAGFEIGAVSWFDGSETHELQPVDGVCGFTMPDGAVLIRASFLPIQLEVPYLDADGALKTATALPIPEGTEEPLEPGWYVVNRDVEFNDRLIFSQGDVHLILADDCTLRITGGGWSLYLICGYYNAASLTVYGQSEGTGVLDFSGGDAGNPFSVEGSYTQNGGTVRFLDSEFCAYTVGDFVLNGGSFIGSVRRDYGLIAEGSFRMTGGVFHVEDDEGCVLDVYNELSILGGQFTAAPADAEGAYGVGGENVTLGCTDPEDFICAGSIRCDGTVQIAEGQVLTDGTAQYSGVISEPSVLDGKTLTPANAYSITVSDCPNGTVISPAKAFAGDSVTLTVTPDAGCGLCSLTVLDADGEPVTVTDNAFTMPESSVTVTAVFGVLIESPTAASGLVYNGSEQTGVAAGEGYTLTGTAAATNAGSYQAEAVLEEGWLWSDGTTEVKRLSWSIAKAPLTIRAEDNSKAYGEDEPELTAAVEGACGDDAIRYELCREEGEHVGAYAISVVPGENPNYEVSVVGATFTIVKADPPYTVPEGLRAAVGQTLEQVKLPAGWTWDDPTQRIEEEGEKSFPASFTPEDTENYLVAEHIELRVNAVFVRFVDVPEGSYYYDPVYWAVAKGITAGTSETTFSPKLTATRAEVVTFLWRMAGSPEPETTECVFEDVPDDAYYRKAVLWATEKRITAGINAERFGSDTVCTREQIITFLWKMAGKPEPSITENPFDDLKHGYSYKAILWAYENGITAGTSPSSFNRKGGCTRAQIVTFLHHYSE